jgi:pyruvate/2-oxoglutarate dehydrogenase complex dihydrolipoamide dehydrogenase (E3) component
MDADGYILANERLETTSPGIWALGDVAGGPGFSNVARDDFRVLQTNLLGPGGASTSTRLVPHTVHIAPPLARIGLREADLGPSSGRAEIRKLSMGAISFARDLGETRGFMKAVLERNSGKILGFGMLGPQAGEVTAVVQVAMMGGLRYDVVRDALFSHPTLAEGLNMLFAPSG